VVCADCQTNPRTPRKRIEGTYPTALTPLATPCRRSHRQFRDARKRGYLWRGELHLTKFWILGGPAVVGAKGGPGGARSRPFIDSGADRDSGIAGPPPNIAGPRIASSALLDLRRRQGSTGRWLMNVRPPGGHTRNRRFFILHAAIAVSKKFAGIFFRGRFGLRPDRSWLLRAKGLPQADFHRPGCPTSRTPHPGR